MTPITDLEANEFNCLLLWEKNELESGDSFQSWISFWLYDNGHSSFPFPPISSVKLGNWLSTESLGAACPESTMSEMAMFGIRVLTEIAKGFFEIIRLRYDLQTVLTHFKCIWWSHKSTHPCNRHHNQHIAQFYYDKISRDPL